MDATHGGHHQHHFITVLDSLGLKFYSDLKNNLTPPKHGKDMKYWVTELKAIDPKTGELRTYGGPHVPGISKKDAERYCQQNGLGYLVVIGRIIAEFDQETGNEINYETPNLN